MLRRLAGVLLLSASIALSMSVPSPGPAAAEASSTTSPDGEAPLPGLSFSTGASLLVDPAHSQILVGSTGGLDVASVDGSSVTHVTAPDHVLSLALSTDKQTLWFSGDCALGATSAARVATAPQVTHVPPGAACPTKIVVDGADRVWFLYSTEISGQGGLGVYDPSSDSFDLHPAVASRVAGLGLLTSLANNPEHPDTVVAAGDGHTTVFDVATGAASGDSAAPSGGWDLAVTAGGQRFAEAGESMTMQSSSTPGAVPDRTSFDADAITDWAEAANAIALSADDNHIVGAYLPYLISFGTAPGDTAWVRRCVVRGEITDVAWSGGDVWFTHLVSGASLGLGHCTDMTTPASVLTVPANPYVLRAKKFASSVRLMYRNQPIAAAHIEVRRTTAAGPSRLPDLTTDPQGNATLTDLASDQASYELTYLGDATRPPTSATFEVIGEKADAMLLTPHGVDTTTVGRSVIITNELYSSFGAVPGASVHITRIDPLGRHRMPDVTTGRNGGFRLRYVARIAGRTRFLIDFAGDKSYLPAGATYDLKVERRTTPLTIHLAKRVVPAGSKALLTVHLGRTFTGRRVSVLERPVGRGSRTIRTARVDRSGDLSIRVAVLRNTRFTARFAGDARFAPREVSVTEWAEPRTSLRVDGAYGRSGRELLYRVGQRIRLVGSVAPARAADCVRIERQVRVAGSYRETFTPVCRPIGPDHAAVSVQHVSAAMRGRYYRFRVVFGGDRLHVRTSSAYHYVHITS